MQPKPREKLISISVAVSHIPTYAAMRGCGYGASASRDVPVYIPAYASTKLYCLMTEACECEKPA